LGEVPQADGLPLLSRCALAFKVEDLFLLCAEADSLN
jgi:hypothetical protein